MPSRASVPTSSQFDGSPASAASMLLSRASDGVELVESPRHHAGRQETDGDPAPPGEDAAFEPGAGCGGNDSTGEHVVQAEAVGRVGSGWRPLVGRFMAKRTLALGPAGRFMSHHASLPTRPKRAERAVIAEWHAPHEM